MLKKATHDSATGEKPGSLLSYLMIPFARTQSKTLREQYEVGVRYFDIRVRRINGVWRCAHGLFYTKRKAWELFEELDRLADDDLTVVRVNITYEGYKADELLEFAKYIMLVCPRILVCTANVKMNEKGQFDWRCIKSWQGNCVRSVDSFVKLDFRDWRTYIPIPWLWKKLYYNKPEFNEEVYTFVDFI